MTWPPWPVGVCIPYALHCMPTPCLVKGKKKRKCLIFRNPFPSIKIHASRLWSKKRQKWNWAFLLAFFMRP